MKIILAFILMFLYAFTFPVLSLAAPSANLSTDSLRRYVFLSFSGLRDVSKLNYTLTYDSGGMTRGFEGLLRPKKYTSRQTKKQILGTCSSGRCVFHKSPTNLQLDVTFSLRSGKSTNIVKTLP